MFFPLGCSDNVTFLSDPIALCVNASLYLYSQWEQMCVSLWSFFLQKGWDVGDIPKLELWIEEHAVAPKWTLCKFKVAASISIQSVPYCQEFRAQKWSF